MEAIFLGFAIGPQVTRGVRGRAKEADFQRCASPILANRRNRTQSSARKKEGKKETKIGRVEGR